jgi:hypothetical protein
MNQDAFLPPLGGALTPASMSPWLYPAGVIFSDDASSLVF